jgi:hypothetical protein
MLVEKHKHIQEIIESLPGIERSQEEQLQKLAEQEEENKLLAQQILARVEEASKTFSLRPEVTFSRNAESTNQLLPARIGSR